MPLDSTTYDAGQRDEVLDLLRRARARVVRPRGWCQRRSNRSDKYCIVGATWYAAFADATESTTPLINFYKMNSLLNNELPPRWRSVGLVAYNDAQGRTQAEVIALVDRAIARLDGRT